ncbi:hypothetical protein RUND412_002514 [Rhizina undulata]
MIDSFGTAKSDNEIAIYAGMVTSAFAFAEFTTGMMWGRISDKFGRKPVLIMGLVGTLLSMLLFGVAKNFPVALLARAVGGALNGNVGVIQTTVAELVPEKEHQPRAFAVMPFIWCLGSIVGPALGGLLAQPVLRYPSVFPPGGLFEEFPYLLPNLVASVVLVVGVAIGILFLEETHEVLKHKPDVGLIAGRKLISFFKGRNAQDSKYEGLNGYWSPASDDRSPLLSPNEESDVYQTFPDTASASGKKPPAVTTAFTRPVVLLIISYGILAYHTMGYEQLFPVFLSTPPADEPPHHLFKFVGGFGLDTQTIGFILSMQGVFSMTTQFFFFPPIVRYFGTLNVYRFCMLMYPLSYIIVPYLDFLPERFRFYGIYACLSIKITFGVLSYPCNAILLTNAVPSLLVLGAVNGMAASTASLCRAFGPTITGLIYSKGLELGVVGLAWWVNAAVCVLGGIECLYMKELDVDGVEEEAPIVIEEGDIEAIAVEAQIAGTTVTGAPVVDEYAIVRKVAEEQEEEGVLSVSFKD